MIKYITTVDATYYEVEFFSNDEPYTMEWAKGYVKAWSDVNNKGLVTIEDVLEGGDDDYYAPVYKLNGESEAVEYVQFVIERKED
jgi:hypothetical protein